MLNNTTPPVVTTVTSVADVSVLKAGPASVLFNTNYDYTITVSNGGPSNVTGAAINDTLPATIRNATWTATYSTGSTGTTSVPTVTSSFEAGSLSSTPTALPSSAFCRASPWASPTVF